MNAVLWMFGAQALFACMNVSARLGSEHVPWQEVTAVRFFFGALAAYLIGRIRGVSLVPKRGGLLWGRTIFGIISAAGTFYVVASRSIAVGDAVTIFSTSPIFVAILSWPILRERVGSRTLVAIGIAFVGIVIVAHPTFASDAHVVAVGFMTALTTAFAMMLLRAMGTESSESVVLHFASVGTLTMTLFAIPVWQWPSAYAALMLLITGITGGLAQLAMTRAYQLDTASRVSAAGYAGIVFIRVLAWPTFHERPSLAQWAGSLLVIASGVLLALKGGRAKRGDPDARTL